MLMLFQSILDRDRTQSHWECRTVRKIYAHLVGDTLNNVFNICFIQTMLCGLTALTYGRL